jgi:hypothetical protein
MKTRLLGLMAALETMVTQRPNHHHEAGQPEPLDEIVSGLI